MNPLLFPVKLYGDLYAWPKRRRVIARALSPMLRGFSRILDIGCGDGLLCRDLATCLPPGVILHGVDVLRNLSPPIPYVVYDGLHLPFSDGAYEASLLVDVLHHSRDPDGLLREAARVSHGCVIVKDHDYRGRVDFALMKAGDYLGNKMFGIDLPYNFRTWRAFETMFGEAGLEIAAYEDSLKPAGRLELHHHFVVKLTRRTPDDRRSRKGDAA
jgi:SAM-dependent methyltransferase